VTTPIGTAEFIGGTTVAILHTCTDDIIANFRTPKGGRVKRNRLDGHTLLTTSGAGTAQRVVAARVDLTISIFVAL
jgi:hypothetical protein